jgi:hypothetical protein
VTSTTDLIRLAQDDHAAALVELEDQVAGSIVGGTAERLDELQRDMTAEWVKAFGNVSEPGEPDRRRAIAAVLRTQLEKVLRELGAGMTGMAATGAASAVELGVEQAAEWAMAAAGRDVEPIEPPPASDATRAAVDGLEGHVADGRASMLGALQAANLAMLGFAGLLAAIGAVRRARAAVDSAVRWLVGQAANDGSEAMVKDLGADKLWIAERDGCVHCAAYSGHVVGGDDDFPGGLTFDVRSPWPDALRTPPLHPRCRCRSVPWLGEWDGNTSGVDLPEALQREAERSILRGWATETESNAARMRAARKLLEQGTDLPKSVRDEARRRLRAGEFRTSPVPGQR